MGNGRRGAVAALAIAIVAFACGGAGIAVRLSSPSSGTSIQTAGDAVTPTGVTVGVLAGATTTLADGDTVVAMAGRASGATTMGGLSGRSGGLAAVARGDRVTRAASASRLAPSKRRGIESLRARCGMGVEQDRPHETGKR